MEKKTIVARAEVLTGKEIEFVRHAEALIKATRNEEGNISYNLYQSPENPVDFIFYEEYTDQSAIDKHGSSEHFGKFAAAIDGLLAKDLIIETF